MKSWKSCIAFLLPLAVAFIGQNTSSAQSTAEAGDRAYEMASKYMGRGFYMTPSREGFAGFATTLEFAIPVNKGLDYIFILAGDRFCLDTDVWIQSESGNTIVRDTRKMDNGLCGVRWRSDYNGEALVVVHFARVTSRCAWAALIGRRGNANAGLGTEPSPGPGTPEKLKPDEQ